jgi:hypothetical protein
MLWKKQFRRFFNNTLLKKRTSKLKLSYEEHRKNALALRGDEGRGKLRKAMGSCKQAKIHRCPNGETRHAEGMSILSE